MKTQLQKQFEKYFDEAANLDCKHSAKFVDAWRLHRGLDEFGGLSDLLDDLNAGPDAQARRAFSLMEDFKEVVEQLGWLDADELAKISKEAGQ